MKTLMLALLAAVAVATAAPAQAQAVYSEDEAAYGTSAAATARAIAAANAGRYAKKPVRTNRAARSPRNGRTARDWSVSRAAGAKKLQLPEYKPYYAKSGSYIPTTFIYQQTNGEFKILRPGGTAPTTGQKPGVNAALQGIKDAGGKPAAPTAPGGQAGGAPVAPPQPPAVQPAGANPVVNAGNGSPNNPRTEPNVPRSTFP